MVAIQSADPALVSVPPGDLYSDEPTIRTHVCPDCGYTEDRDINAAINILKLGLSTVGHTGTYAWGDLPSWAPGILFPQELGKTVRSSFIGFIQCFS